MRISTLILAILLFLAAAAVFADDNPPAPPVKLVLTKIDATGSAGLCLTQSKDFLVLKNLQGAVATSFVAQESTVKVTPAVAVQDKTINKTREYISATQTWSLTDASGEGIKVTNNTLKTLVIVSQIDKAVALKYGVRQVLVPGHSFMLVNNPPKDLVLDLGSTWTAFYGQYTEKLSTVVQPTLVEISPNGEGIENGLPVLNITSIFGEPLRLRGE